MNNGTGQALVEALVTLIVCAGVFASALTAVESMRDRAQQQYQYIEQAN